MNTFQPQLPDLLPEAGREVRDFERRKLTIKTLGGFASDIVRREYGEAIAEAYSDEQWTYRQLAQYSVDVAGFSRYTAPQVFRRWHNLTAIELDLIPIAFESAKQLSYDLRLLGAAVISHVLKTPVTSELLSSFHAHRLGQLTPKA